MAKKVAATAADKSIFKTNIGEHLHVSVSVEVCLLQHAHIKKVERSSIDHPILGMFWSIPLVSAM
jgi:hypothetical protein